MSDGISGLGLTKRFKDHVALDGVDVRAPSGQITAITGANGAGKTTLLKIFSTVLRADAGTASVNGLDVVSDDDAVRRIIGVALVNERAMYWRLSAAHNLRFFARASGLGRAHAAAAATVALEAVGLTGHAKRRVDGFSAGQRQRLNIARALVAAPAVLLVDEPFRGLDEDGIGRVRDLLSRQAAAGKTVVVAAPTIGEVQDLCTSVVRLDRGRVGEVVSA